MVGKANGTVIGSGCHPDSQFGNAPLIDSAHYRQVAKSMRGLLQRTPEAALHVHVGIGDPETAIRVANRLRVHLPVLQALCANSPYWFGRDSGLASARAALVRAYPRRGVPRAFVDFSDYVSTVSAITAAGELEDYTLIWWDVRPHPRLGTVEVRELDSQFSLEAVACVATLIQCLARYEANAPAKTLPCQEAIAESCFRASRDGLDASIYHAGTLSPVGEVADATISLAKTETSSSTETSALDGVYRILAQGNGASHQRAVHATAGMPGLMQMLVDRTQAHP
jgi:carboxylate-amine ligase